MPSMEIFKKGLVEIENVFEGFNLTENKIKIWYKYSKHLPDNVWKYKIKNCIKGCRKVPALADILDLQGYYVDKKEMAELNRLKIDKDWEDFKNENFDGTPIPKNIKSRLDKLLLSWRLK